MRVFTNVLAGTTAADAKALLAKGKPPSFNGRTKTNNTETRNMAVATAAAAVVVC